MSHRTILPLILLLLVSHKQNTILIKLKLGRSNFRRSTPLIFSGSGFFCLFSKCNGLNCQFGAMKQNRRLGNDYTIHCYCIEHLTKIRLLIAQTQCTRNFSFNIYALTMGFSNLYTLLLFCLMSELFAWLGNCLWVFHLVLERFDKSK